MLIRWFIDNEIQLGNPTTRFEIENAIRTFNGKIVKCEVNNDIGKSEETEVLDVHCKIFLNKILENAKYFG